MFCFELESIDVIRTNPVLVKMRFPLLSFTLMFWVPQEWFFHQIIIGLWKSLIVSLGPHGYIYWHKKWTTSPFNSYSYHNWSLTNSMQQFAFLELIMEVNILTHCAYLDDCRIVNQDTVMSLRPGSRYRSMNREIYSISFVHVLVFPRRHYDDRLVGAP